MNEFWGYIPKERYEAIIDKEVPVVSEEQISYMNNVLSPLIGVQFSVLSLPKPPTPREPSARLTQKVTFKNVIPDRDLLLVIAYNLEENKLMKDCFSPTIKSIGLFPVYSCILARDLRMYREGGGWFGNLETPTILSNIGKLKLRAGESLDYSMYGRKESEGRDFNEDTNFGKLKRIPYEPLQKFLAAHRLW